MKHIRERGEELANFCGNMKHIPAMMFISSAFARMDCLDEVAHWGLTNEEKQLRLRLKTQCLVLQQRYAS